MRGNSMQTEVNVQSDQPVISERPAWRNVLAAITILLIIFNTIMIIVVDTGSYLDIAGISSTIPYRGFWISLLYEAPPFFLTLFAAFMNKSSMVTFSMAAATAAFFVIGYLA